jgi:hypothetical protein
VRSGTCPKCGGDSVHAARGAFSWGTEQGARIRTSPVIWPTQLDTYICTLCGYFEHYVADPGKLAEVSQTWARVTPS